MIQSHLNSILNPLRDYLIIQFEPHKIVMQDTRTKAKYFYKEIVLRQDPQLFLAQLNERTSIRHQGLITLYFHQWKQNVVGLLSQYCPTHLEDEILRRSKARHGERLSCSIPFFTQQQLINTFSPIISCLDTLHKQRLVHGHLKARNIIVNENFQTKLCDAILIDQDTENRQSIIRNAYFPPEFQYSTDISIEGDLWALGVVILEATILESLESFYDRQRGRVSANELQSRIEDINQSFSDQYVVSIKLLLSSDKTIRKEGIKVITDRVIPEGIIYEKMRPQRNKVNNRFYDSESPKKMSCPQPQQCHISLNSTQLPPGRIIAKQEVLNESNNHIEEKKTKTDHVKEKYRSRHSEEMEVKRKQIDKINKIIERSNAFVNELMAKRNEKPSSFKPPSLGKTTLNLSMSGYKRELFNENSKRLQKTPVREKQQRDRQTLLSNASLLVSELEVRQGGSCKQSPKKLHLKKQPEKLKSLGKKK